MEYTGENIDIQVNGFTIRSYTGHIDHYIGQPVQRGHTPQQVTKVRPGVDVQVFNMFKITSTNRFR